MGNPGPALDESAVRRLIELAADEDLGSGDLTARLLDAPERLVQATLVARAPGTLCGLAVAPLVCEAFSRRLNAALSVAPSARAGRFWADGDAVMPADAVATVAGPHAAVLAMERTLLNVVCRLSGVATLTRRFVDAARAANAAVQIYDTRKTIPGWRALDKYAVRCGNGHNHRMGLYDAVLVKDNHLAGIPTSALREHVAALLRRLSGHPAFVEVEVDHLGQFVEVCEVPGIDVILLDNFTLADTRTAVAHRDARGLQGRVALEASGAVTLQSVAALAGTGVDRIAIGGITHSATALDFGLDM